MKKKKNTKKTSSKKKQNANKHIKRFFIGSTFIALFVVTFMAYSKINQVHYDLSVIGTGKPTVVQIHDPNCPMCRQLKRNLDSVKGDFSDDMHFKIANIVSKKGREFANRYQVPHVTLLFFDKRGKHVNTLQGVTPASDIHAALKNLSKR